MLTRKGIPAVLLDPARLKQVLSNLVGNAPKFLGDNPSPRVEVGGEREGGLVTVFVRDNGIGIPDLEQEAVFQPFMRLEAECSPGLGIGLSTVKRAVEAWGGEVWAESAPGEGSTFYFTAPAAE